jgi:histidyl-tRNA synthetase
MSTTKPPSGTRDFLPEDIRRREYVIDVVRDVFEKYGFEPLETPAFENIETLLGKYGEEGNQLIFKILRRGEHEAGGGADLALRYDLTVPLARVVAQHQNALPRFFKRYQIQAVWRADRPARGRFREFVQCDIDTIGTTSNLVEVEQLAAVSDVLEQLGFVEFTIRLNHRRVLAGLLESAGIRVAQHADALTALDKLDKIGRDGVLADMSARGIEPEAAVRGLRLAGETSFAVHRQALQGLKDAAGHLHAVSALEEIIALSGQTAAGRHVKFDPSLARGLSYYTGAIMEIAVPDLAGSLGGGGRYDNLIGMFLGRDVPACGFSLGLERIIVVMTERAMFPPEIARGAVDVMVAIWNHETRDHSLALATELRRSGVRVDVYPEADKIGKQFKYASSRNVPFVALVGDDERARGEVAIKDLRSGDQKSIPRSDVGAFVKQRIKAEPLTQNPEPRTLNPEP